MLRGSLCPSPPTVLFESPIANVPFTYPGCSPLSFLISPTTLLPLIYKSHESGSAVQSHCNAESFVISSLHLLLSSSLSIYYSLLHSTLHFAAASSHMLLLTPDLHL